MGNVVELFRNAGEAKYQFDYIVEDGEVIGVTCNEWPFRIMRRDDKVALVCEETDQPFGIIDRDVFNTLVMCWLLIDDPKLIDEAATSGR